MPEKKRWITLGCIVILLAAVGSAGFYVGKSKEDSYYKNEKNLSILLNRSDLEGLGNIAGKIYVTGHKSPDSDTVGSSIAYAALLNKLGYDAEPVVLGPVNNESAYILEVAGLETPKLLKDASGLNMVLVDHSEHTQSADGLKNANIISIIDHHGAGSVMTANPLIFDARPLGSAATIVWLRYRNYGIEPDRQSAVMMLGSILSDTKNLKSDTTTFADREAVKELSRLGGISDPGAFYQGMFSALLSYEGKVDEEIFLSDYKEYFIGGRNVAVGNVNAFDEETAKDLALRMHAVMPLIKPDKGMDMCFSMVSVLHDDISVTYLVPAGEEEEKVLKAAFGDKAHFDGKSFIIKPYASRKAVFIPAITKVLEADDGEKPAQVAASVKTGNKVYFAAPLFNQSEKDYNLKITNILESYGYEVFLPQRDGYLAPEIQGMTQEEAMNKIFQKDLEEVLKADIIFIMLDGRVPDEGACVELGIGYANGKRCYGFKTDARSVEFGLDLNPMITGCFEKLFYNLDGDKLIEELKQYLSENTL